MDSSGIAGRIQVTEETKQILEKEGFDFECRGEIDVKGKGLMTTYLLRKEGEEYSCPVINNTTAEEPIKSMNGDIH
uniref:adenylate cyclase n=1 Tax=Ditylenchus dipsaci TaxID=166011 RepID=A0A915ERY6_9BILA